MAQRIPIRPTQTATSAPYNSRLRPQTDDELERLEGRLAEINGLIDELYDNGIIRWMKDFTGAMPEIAAIATGALNNPQGHAGMRNLLVMAKQLGQIDPDQLERLFDAARAGVDKASRASSADGSAYNPPGMTGTAKLLYDRELWSALAPVLEGVKAFSAARRAQQADNGDTPGAADSETPENKNN